MFETEIIDSRADRKRESFFNRFFDVLSRGTSSLALVLLAGLAVYFFALIPAEAYFLVLMALTLLFVLMLIIKFSASRRVRLGRLLLTDRELNIKLGDKQFSYPIDNLQEFAIYKVTDTPIEGDAPSDSIFYGNNWITFTVNGSPYKYEFAIDSDYESKKLDRLASILQSKYRQFSFITSPEKSVTDDR